MKGKSALIWLGLAGAAGAVLFQTSYEVQGREEQLAALNRKIVAEQEAIQILKAEWSYLNDLSRLETLARTHLSLRPTDARQFVASADVIPMRPARAEPQPLPPMAGLSPAQPLPAGVYAPGNVQPQPAVATAKTPAPAVTAARAPAPAPAPAAAMVQPASAKSVAPAPAAPKAQPAIALPQAQPQPAAIPASTVKPLTLPSQARPAVAPAAPPKTDSLGVMIARLGGNR